MSTMVLLFLIWYLDIGGLGECLDWLFFWVPFERNGKRAR